MITVRAESSFIRLVYSFALDPDEDRHPARPHPGALLARLKERTAACGWEDQRILYDYVLPHLADHVNVDDRVDGETEVGHWWRCTAELPSRWTLRVSSTRHVELSLGDVDLLFFRTGIGMLLLDVRPASECLDDWQDALHLARFYRLPATGEDMARSTSHGRRVFTRRAALLVAVTDDDREPSAAPAGPLGSEPTRPCGFGLLIHRLLTEVLGERVWRRASVPGLLTPFSAFFVDGEGADERAQFEAQYRWRRQLRSSATVAAEDHHDLHAEMRLYAEGMWLAYSSEGGGFFAQDAPRSHFFEHELPDHLRRPYTFGYLLALHQRLALNRFSERIARVVATSRGQWTPDQPPRDTIARLQDDFLEYLTRCHFAQVFRTTNHHANYKGWEEALEVPAFAREVELQLRHLYERTATADRILDEKRRTHQSGRVNAAVLGIALPTVLLAVLAVAYPAGLELAMTVALTVASVAVGTAIGWLTATRHGSSRGAVSAR